MGRKNWSRRSRAVGSRDRATGLYPMVDKLCQIAWGLSHQDSSRLGSAEGMRS